MQRQVVRINEGDSDVLAETKALLNRVNRIERWLESGDKLWPGEFGQFTELLSECLYGLSRIDDQVKEILEKCDETH